MLKLYINKDNKTVSFLEQKIDNLENSVTFKEFSATFELIRQSYIGMTSTKNFFHYIKERSEVQTATYTFRELCEDPAYEKPLFDLWKSKEDFKGDKDFEMVFFLTNLACGDGEKVITEFLWKIVLKNYYLNEEHVLPGYIALDGQYTLVHYEEDGCDYALAVNLAKMSFLTYCNGNVMAIREESDKKSLLFLLANSSHKNNIKIIKSDISESKKNK